VTTAALQEAVVYVSVTASRDGQLASTSTPPPPPPPPSCGGTATEAVSNVRVARETANRTAVGRMEAATTTSRLTLRMSVNSRLPRPTDLTARGGRRNTSVGTSTAGALGRWRKRGGDQQGTPAEEGRG